MPTPRQRKKLDATLANFQQASYDLSLRVKQAIKALKKPPSGEYHITDLSELARTAKQLTDTTAKFIEIAPFFAHKQSLEALAHYREWLLLTPEYAGDFLEKALESIEVYEQLIYKDAGFLEREQFQLPLVWREE